MNIVFIVRSNLFSTKGGDTIQVKETADHLIRHMNLSVDIKFSYDHIDYDKYDLLHFFNITRPADILAHVRRSKKPFVISTIYVDYSEYDKKYRTGYSGKIFKLFSGDNIEYLKTVARVVKGKDRLVSWEYLWKGQKRSIKIIGEKAACLLPNSENEYLRFTNQYQVRNKYRVVPNGVGRLFLDHPGEQPRNLKMVLCVARIEGIKNQLNLIKALNNSDFQLYIIGAYAPNQKEYYDECRRVAADNIFFIDFMSQLDLLNYYAKAKVHILPSWFETTGLSSLEAAAMGCNIIITDRGDAKEYFKEFAFYCDPGSLSSIYKAVVNASTANVDDRLRNFIRNNYTWEKAAAETYIAYKETINNI